MSLYEVLKASKTNRFPDYWTLLWGRKLSASMIKTLTGALPLTFTAKAGNAVDWVIYGNDDNGTENLWDLTIEQGSFDAQTGAPAGGTRRVRTAESILLSGNSWTVALTGADRCGVYVYDTSGNYIAGESEYYWKTLPHTFTLSGERKVKFVFSTSDDAQITPSMVSQPMLVKGSTAPDHYIPYQKGVGEIANVWDNTVLPYANNRPSVAPNGDGSFTITNTYSSTGNTYIAVKLGNSLSIGKTYTFRVTINNLTSELIKQGNAQLCFRNSANAIVSSQVVSGDGTYECSGLIGDNGWTVGVIFCYQNIQFSNVVLSNICLSDGSYQIPLTVSQSGQTDKNYNFYIGDSPLTEGETVSKTSTGIDIELFEGSNTLDTTLYNKPDMEIKYK